MIPADVIAQIAGLGLTAEQAAVVAAMLHAVETATRDEAGAQLDARRANDAERARRYRANRHVTSRDERNPSRDERDASRDERDVTLRPTPLDKEIPPTPPKETNPPTHPTIAGAIVGARASRAQKLDTQTARDVLLGCLQPDTADAVLAHRKAKKSPLTPYAAQLLVKGFNATADPEDAAQTMIARGWQGFKPEWYDNDRRNGEKRSAFDIAGERLQRRVDALYTDQGGLRSEGGGQAGEEAVQFFSGARSKQP